MVTESEGHHRSLARLISLAERAVTHHLQEQFLEGHAGITVPQWRALYFLWMEDGRTQQAIADYVGSTKSSMTRMISGLEKLGLVRRAASEKDGREKLVVLTDEGRSMRAKLLPLGERTIQAAEQGITDEEIRVCRGVLERVITNLGFGAGWEEGIGPVG